MMALFRWVRKGGLDGPLYLFWSSGGYGLLPAPHKHAALTGHGLKYLRQTQNSFGVTKHQIAIGIKHPRQLLKHFFAGRAIKGFKYIATENNIKAPDRA
jgi:hypothetical protein